MRGLRCAVLIGGCCASVLPRPAAEAGVVGITPLVLEGDLVPGVGLVTRIDNIAVNDAGQWIVEADTDNPDTEADSVVIRDGVILLREGHVLGRPPGASIGSFDSITLDAGGDSAWNFFLDGTQGIFDDSGIFLNTQLVVQEGAIATAAGFSPGTPYIGFFDVKNGAPGRFVSVLSVDDPAIETTVDRAVVLFEESRAGFTQHVLALEGAVLPAELEPIADFGTGPHESAFNAGGDVLVFVDLAGATETDGTIYLIEVDDDRPRVDGFTRLAAEGSASPVPGRDWLALSTPRLDLSDTGGYAFSGRLSGDTASDLIIVRGGAKLVQEGDPVPGGAAGGFLLTGFGSGPVEIDDAGKVLWYGDWDDPDTTVDTGLFLEDRLLVQEGLTLIDGVAVDELRGVEDGYHGSGGGRFVIFEALLAGGIEGAFLIDLGAPCPSDCGDPPDGSVGIVDLLALLGQWGGAGACDTGGDGIVGIADLLALLGAWGPCP
jgi:hypothetical protein